MQKTIYRLVLPLLFLSLMLVLPILGQEKQTYQGLDSLYKGMKWRNIGPFRGGRSVASSGVIGDPLTYYMGTCGGGVWKTEDAGVNWKNISDGFFKTGSVGAIAVAPSDPNVIYVGMGEHPVRGVMTTHGDGVYKSVDAGKTWKHIGLDQSMHIAEIEIHPQNPDIVYVAVQGAPFGPTEDRGLYMSEDGGMNWEKVLYVNNLTGVSDISMDVNNPRILYASTWENRRYPWLVSSGGVGSGIHKSKDGGKTWKRLETGLPKSMGKVSADVSAANSNVVYANIEAEGEQGGVYRSNDGGQSWKQTSKDRVTVARAWYYIEIFADPQDENKVYVLNAPMLKSIDGGKTFENISNPHGDQHHLWINPDNPENIILSNDGGACVTFNGGKSWSSQQNQPTAQFYRVITDSRFPYHVYGGQQDNSSVCIASRAATGLGWKAWYAVSGCESAFLAFDPNNPIKVYGGCYQGNISVYNHTTDMDKDILAYPTVGLGWTPSEMRYRFNWNAPIVASPFDYSTIYHAGNVVLRTTDGGLSWEEISPDLTRNEKEKQIDGGAPYTNEGAGGEVYNTISYLECSPHSKDVIWVGSDDGLVHLTKNGGQNWENITPKGIGEALINAIDVSPHAPGTAYITVTKYKFNDLTPMVYRTENYGKDWKLITKGIDQKTIVRVVREDLKQPGLLYAGTEAGLYVSKDQGANWHAFQLNLPKCPITDLTFQDNDLVVSTMGRAFWILDDLSALQQSMESIPGETAVIFNPKPAYRINTSSGRRGTFGENAPNGVIIDYYLPEKIDSNGLQLMIKNSAGETLRTYTSLKDENYKKYDGGPSPKKKLGAKVGLNRMVWDMRRGSLPGVDDIFIFGNYGGPLVGPGSYTIELMNGEEKLGEASCEIKPDPRLEVELSAYTDQQDVLENLQGIAMELIESVNVMRAYKQQVESLIKPLENQAQAQELKDKAEEIMKKIDDWQHELIQPQQKTFQDVINFPNQLTSEIMNLISRIDQHDPRLTKGAKERSNDLKERWMQKKTEMNNLIDADLQEFNKIYKEQNIPALILNGKA